MGRFPGRAITLAMATLLKIAARISAIMTLAVATIILGSQAASWILTGEWRSFPISKALALADLGREAIYVTASVSEHSYSLGLHTIFDWFLDLPAIGFLMVVALVNLGFSVFAVSVEKKFGTTED
jgi:hypothetical protein